MIISNFLFRPKGETELSVNIHRVSVQEQVDARYKLYSCQHVQGDVERMTHFCCYNVGYQIEVSGYDS